LGVKRKTDELSMQPIIDWAEQRKKERIRSLRGGEKKGGRWAHEGLP